MRADHPGKRPQPLLGRVLNQFNRGFVASVPAAILIWWGFVDGTEPTAWVLFGIAALLGVPWNLIALGILFGSFYLLAAFGVGFKANALILLMWSVILAGVIGAHVNGALLAMALSRKPRSAQDSGTPDKQASDLRELIAELNVHKRRFGRFRE